MNLNREEGVPDFVLLETVSEAAFYDNLKHRFAQNNIYVCISFFIFFYFLFHGFNYIFLDIHWRCGCFRQSFQEIEYL